MMDAYFIVSKNFGKNKKMVANPEKVGQIVTDMLNEGAVRVIVEKQSV